MPIAIVIFGILFSLTAFEWTIVDRITPFLYFPLLGLAWLSFAISAIVFAVSWYRRRGAGLKAGKPLLLHLVVLITLIVVPFTSIELWMDFHTKKADREAIIEAIQSGKLQPNVPHNKRLISLGSTRRLSAGGNEVMVETTERGKYVFFFTYRGILENYSGFLYVPAGGRPESFGPRGERTAQVVQFSTHWYFMSRS